MDTDAASLFWFLVPGVVIPLALTWRAFRSPTDRQLRRWATTCGVELTPETELMVRAHLGRVRRFRSVAALPFWWLYVAPLVFGSDLVAVASPAPALVAYLVGGLVAELTARPVEPGAARSASFVPRTVADYRPAWLEVVPWVLLALAAGFSVVPRLTGSSVGNATAPAAVVVALALVVLAEVAARRVARRPQRSGSTDVLAADDALRATAVSLCAGVALLVGTSAVQVAALAAATGSSGVVPLLLQLLLLPVQMLGFGALWCIVRQETWGYRPRHRQVQQVGAA